MLKYILYVIFIINCSIIFSTDIYIYPKPESENDTRYNHRWELLKMALEKTKNQYGDYILKESEYSMPEKRIVLNLVSQKDITITRATTNIELEEQLLPVRIPLLKGILGYRIFLINKKNQKMFSEIPTIEQLKTKTVGQGFGWSDVALLESNGFKVITANDYESLFKLLVIDRFDYFSRGINEAYVEFDERKKTLTNLVVEEKLCLHYPFAEYFFFNKNDYRLAQRVEEGLKIMIKDGSFDKIFDKYYKNLIIKANLKNRKIFKITNPFLPSDTPINIKEYWIDPTKY